MAGREKTQENVDVEKLSGDDGHLLNTTVEDFSFGEVTVTVKDRETKASRVIVDNAEGVIKAGEVCALIGPSGCGKTTLLNVLARRPTNAASVEANVLVNGQKLSLSQFQKITCFVEQEDALIGALTVRETLDFSSRLSSSSLSRQDRESRINGLLSSFGLTQQANTLIGTPILKGLSGGQKRRVGVASQLITSPKILFLDEPTSGLDSVASWEVVNYLRKVAKQNNLIVICSIHQPSTSTFNLFDTLMLLSGGKTHYFGHVDQVLPYLESVGVPAPQHVNPAEFVLELLNTDFATDKTAAAARIENLHAAWLRSPQAKEVQQSRNALASQPPSSSESGSGGGGGGEGGAAVIGTALDQSVEAKPGPVGRTLTLLHRSLVKSLRDVVAYGIRFAMYMGLAIMVGTVWVRLDTDQQSIQAFINAIFFGSAFMSFMAVAYVPSFLEDRSMYVKERRNGLYGPTELVVSNFVVGVPFLFLISLVFSAVAYWLCNFRPSAAGFLTFLMWLFLDLLAAESLVVLMSALMPNFVVALALVAFANGLWMSVGGFMISPRDLNVFYRYVFHYWDYQKYVFEGMMVNEFGGRAYSCGEGCHCMYRSELLDQCKIAGQAVLDQYGYRPGHLGRDVGIMFAIVAGYRLAAWVVLKLRKD
ncbi:ABC transporter G family member 12 [Escovopsis weberi]|uniref:ABC transporter G family member 12 n=1 Tax=Escovopsis weberi TaxID=150374 RepID=A0A0M8N2V1_ESCWE|nr:ABC transporter G family member 12 [Escovopsis weberi]